MAKALRLEFPNALFISRGDRREGIYEDDEGLINFFDSIG